MGAAVAGQAPDVQRDRVHGGAGKRSRRKWPIAWSSIVGEYNPELGYSYGEIAGMSRSQHRSQGMGAPEQKGSMKNYLVTIAGDKASKDVFEDIDTTWRRVPGGGRGRNRSRQSRAEHSCPRIPSSFCNALTEARPLIAAIKDPLGGTGSSRNSTKPMAAVRRLCGWMPRRIELRSRRAAALKVERYGSGSRPGAGHAARRGSHGQRPWIAAMTPAMLWRPLF